MATVADLQTLGLTCGMAHGSVEVEQDALANAQAAADPAVVAGQVNQVTADTVKALDNVGKLPETPEERRELATRIAEDALSILTTAASDKVAFHERAVAIAQESPDVWVVQHFVDDQLVVQLYVACKADGTGWDDNEQATLDALSNKAAFLERVSQIRNPQPPAKAK